MSQINVNRIKDSNEGAPDFPSGVNVGGITSTVTLGVTNLNPTNLNVSGVVTATTFDGTLLATGTPTLGVGVTINTSGVNISGVATAGIVSATTLYGDGANITGIALTIAPLNYNPAVYGVDVGTSQGIGITFNQGVKAGSGNVTLRLVGAAGTVVENFGVGNSVSYGNSDYGTTVTITPTADLAEDTVYHLSYPSGAFTNIGGDVSYVGTAYTFNTHLVVNEMWAWGENSSQGALGLNNIINYSSPVQLPGTTWQGASGGRDSSAFIAVLSVRTDGTLWAWGSNSYGSLGDNSRTFRSSPVQIPGTTWKQVSNGHVSFSVAVKTNGQLWAWGYNNQGQLGQNNTTKYSSPVQIPGTTWRSACAGTNHIIATKTDGTLWSWGQNDEGILGQHVHGNSNISSPIQIGSGTDWTRHAIAGDANAAIKTDGTLWTWGKGSDGQLGLNVGGPSGHRSSPVQVPGTTWSSLTGTFDENIYTYAAYRHMGAIQTDGSLYAWGYNVNGQLGQGNVSDPYERISSPIQIPGTWSNITSANAQMSGVKTDGTLWMWGQNTYGVLGRGPANVSYSSPIQVGEDATWISGYVVGQGSMFGVKRIFT